MVFHVLNRAVARLALFEKNADYGAAERVMVDALILWSVQMQVAR